MTIQRKIIAQTPRRTFPKIFNFDMGRHDHFWGRGRDLVPELSEGGRQETLVTPGRVSGPAKGEQEGMKEEPDE